MNFRPETNDAHIWDDVVNRNEYRLPDSLEGKTVLDIGGHIGAFSYAALKRGADRCYVFEPFKESYRLLLENLVEFGGRVIPCNAAVWSRTTVMAQNFEPVNKGGMAVFGTTYPCFAIGINEIVEAIGKVDLLKIDCEGSEFSILGSCKMYSRITEIVGEYHEHGIWDYSVLALMLKNEGFQVTRNELARPVDQFWAKKSNQCQE
jgi:FkbM family methyltransferase